MTSGTYIFGDYTVQAGYTNDTFQRNKISVFVQLNGLKRWPPFEIPCDTPDDQLKTIVSVYLAVTEAIDQSRYQLQEYGKLN